MILDTSVLIDLHRGLPPARAWFGGLTVLPRIAGMAAMEFVEGARDRNELRTVWRLLSLFSVAWPTEEDMIRAHHVYQPLRLAHSIKMNDCLIAATATGLGEDLATFDKHFRAVPSLSIVQPYTR